MLFCCYIFGLNTLNNNNPMVPKDMCDLITLYKYLLINLLGYVSKCITKIMSSV